MATRLDYVNERLNLIYSLQQKHHVQTIEELIAVQTDYHEKLNAITSFDDRIAELTAQKETLYDKVIKQAAVLKAVMNHPKVGDKDFWALYHAHISFLCKDYRQARCV